MASIQYGSMITGLKGSVHGTTFQGGYASQVLRGKTRFKTNFTRALVVKSNATLHNQMAYISQSWRGLSPTVQGAYASAAPSFPFIDKWGNSYTPSAFQLFVWQQLNLAAAGLDYHFVAPLVTTFPDLSGLSLAVSSSSAFTFSWSTSLPNNFKLILSTGVGVSAGKSVFKSGLKALGVAAPAGLTSYNAYTAFSNAWGAPVTGLKYFCSIRMVHTTQGCSAAPLFVSAIST